MIDVQVPWAAYAANFTERSVSLHIVPTLRQALKNVEDSLINRARAIRLPHYFILLRRILFLFVLRVAEVEVVQAGAIIDQVEGTLADHIKLLW